MRTNKFTATEQKLLKAAEAIATEYVLLVLKGHPASESPRARKMTHNRIKKLVMRLFTVAAIANIKDVKSFLETWGLAARQALKDGLKNRDEGDGKDA